MTEKRFTVDEGLENILCWEINDKENEDMTCGECAKLLNELYEENKEFKKENAQFDILIKNNQLAYIDLEKENEELKQFKEDVFNKIDMHLRLLPTARDIEFNDDDGDPSLYVGAIYMLETLKKELQE